jgi:hypothetical protein
MALISSSDIGQLEDVLLDPTGADEGLDAAGVVGASVQNLVGGHLVDAAGHGHLDLELRLPGVLHATGGQVDADDVVVGHPHLALEVQCDASGAHVLVAENRAARNPTVLA